MVYRIHQLQAPKPNTRLGAAHTFAPDVRIHYISCNSDSVVDSFSDGVGFRIANIHAPWPETVALKLIKSSTTLSYLTFAPSIANIPENGNPRNSRVVSTSQAAFMPSTSASSDENAEVEGTDFFDRRIHAKPPSGGDDWRRRGKKELVCIFPEISGNYPKLETLKYPKFWVSPETEISPSSVHDFFITMETCTRKWREEKKLDALRTKLKGKALKGAKYGF
ncbi:hypothetical protein GPALN_006114 [Globodera pallida]|nr:hypothetical protein GPALN_006114 [Globodera pallida]